MQRQNGFAYLLLLLVIALLGLVASTALSVGSALARRDAEQALLWVGLEYQRALRTYTAAGPAPRSLDDLLRDPRVPGLRRHLRQRHADPLTGKDEWGLVSDASGGIIGIYSLAAGRPLKQDGFDSDTAHLAQAERYSDWVFGLPAAQQRAAPHGTDHTVNPSLQSTASPRPP